MPHFDYWSSILGNLKNKHLKSLNVLQNSTIKYIFDLGYYDLVSNFRQSLNWQEIADRFKFNSTCFLFKVLLFQYPDFLYSKLKYRIPSIENSGRNLKNSRFLLITANPTHLLSQPVRTILEHAPSRYQTIFFTQYL